MSRSFKTFLLEAAVSDEPLAQKLDIQKAINTLRTKCSDALWMIENNTPFFRGGKISSNGISGGFGIVDPSKTERKSNNTSNHYTVILDSHPQMGDFPKRSRSFVATTDEFTADQYGSIYILIPFNGVKVGLTNQIDIWYTTIKLFGRNFVLEEFADTMTEMGIDDTLEGFKDFDKNLKAKKLKHITTFNFQFPHLKKGDTDRFLAGVYEAFSPTNTGFESVTTKDSTKLKSAMSKNMEVWVGGPCLVISYSAYKKIRKELKNDR